MKRIFLFVTAMFLSITFAKPLQSDPAAYYKCKPDNNGNFKIERLGQYLASASKMYIFIRDMQKDEGFKLIGVLKPSRRFQIQLPNGSYEVSISYSSNNADPDFAGKNLRFYVTIGKEFFEDGIKYSDENSLFNTYISKKSISFFAEEKFECKLKAGVNSMYVKEATLDENTSYALYGTDPEQINYNIKGETGFFEYNVDYVLYFNDRFVKNLLNPGNK